MCPARASTPVETKIGASVLNAKATASLGRLSTRKNLVPRPQGYGGDKCIIPDLGDRDPDHPRFQIPEKVPQQVMRHGPRGAHMTKRYEDGFRLRDADPKGEDFSAGLDVFQNQNGRPASGIGNHAPDLHPLYGRSGPVGGKRAGRAGSRKRSRPPARGRSSGPLSPLFPPVEAVRSAWSAYSVSGGGPGSDSSTLPM